MKQFMRKCSDCKIYTLKYQCPKCNHPTFNPHPAKYSPDDKYIRYRIEERYTEIE
jgi:H/ACA ribonucleoprotein complex subunit 3